MNGPLSPERAAKICRLFEDLSELPRNQRSVYLDHACAGDDGLKRELLSLIEHADHSSVFFAWFSDGVVRPALERFLCTSAPDLLPGSSPEVRALDALLQRCVAQDPKHRIATAHLPRKELLTLFRACPLLQAASKRDSTNE